ncbi:MAG: MFS transporter [Candidatus Methylacidiphilales bacterium]|nr:MFS transporter [Candidatus Methylacidiphilales bacterium]
MKDPVRVTPLVSSSPAITPESPAAGPVLKTPEHSSVSKPLTLGEKIGYGSGGIAFVLAYSLLSQLAFPIFNISLGMNATLVGVALAVGRFWDAITDPVMGWFSDNARTPWGRRCPFILLGGLLCALTFPLFWFISRGWPEWGQFAWLTGCIILYYTSTTVFCVPYLSLGYELNPDPIERTRLQAWSTYFIAAVSLGMPWIYRGAQSEVFPDTLTGMRWLGVLCGVVFFASALPVFLGCREPRDASALQGEKSSFWNGFVLTLSNRPFVLLVLGVVTTMLAVPTLIGSLAVYINTYYIFNGDTKTGAAYAAAFTTLYYIVKFTILPFSVKLVARFGKIRVMQGALWVGIFGSISQYFLYTPAAPWLQFVTALFLSPALTCFWLLVNPMKADCTDYDEWKTGQRRSGSYAAVANWMEKMAMSVFLVFSGMLLDWSGFDPALGAAQAEQTTWIWRMAFAGVPATGYAIALVCLHFYPLTDEKMSAIRADLEARNILQEQAP